jgi:hypothetical protein
MLLAVAGRLAGCVSGSRALSSVLLAVAGREQRAESKKVNLSSILLWVSYFGIYAST